MQKILSFSNHEVSALHTSNTESLDGLSFFPICSYPGDIQHLFHKSEIGDTDTFKFVLFAFGKNMFPHLLLTSLFIKYQKNPTKIPKPILQIQWIIHSIPEKKHFWYYFDVTQSKYLHLDGSATHWILWYTFTYHDNFPLFLTPLGTFHSRQIYCRKFKSLHAWNQHQRRYQRHGPLSLHPHQPIRHQPSLRRNSKKNWKLYGRSSQSSQIIPGILQ